MLKQRHSISGLSAKTLSRSKCINRTIQQPHNVSTQSGKQGRTLRYPTKNKSCLIPKHLAQSTQSHIINSNQSNRYKTNNRNHQPSQKINNNIQNFNSNNQKQTSQSQYNLKTKGNLIESKLTQPQNHFRSSTIGNPQLKFSYQPFLSVPAQQSHFKGNILSRLSDLTQNISSSQLVQNIPSMIQKAKNQTQNNFNKANMMMRQKVLEKEVKQSFLYKNMELSKALQEMQRFCICVNELKWVCEQVNMVIKKYNKEIVNFYQEYCVQSPTRNDLENILTQSQQLRKRFNKLEIMNQSSGPLFNFNLLANNTFNTSLLQQKNEKSHIINFRKTQNNQSPHNQHSWSKLIQNIQQNPLLPNHNNNKTQSIIHYTNNNIHTAPNDENKNISIGTFQVTQTSSPFKNKTLNQLIRLSQLRKTQFLSNYDSSNKENNPNQTNQKYNHKQHYMNNDNRFTKKPRLSQIGLRQISPQKDPFDSIHLPHFNTKPQNISIKQQHYMSLGQKEFYEQQILRLNKVIQAANIENMEIHRKMDRKYKQLKQQYDRVKHQQKEKEQNFNRFEKAVYRFVQTALHELVNCSKLNNTMKQQRKGSYSMNNLGDIERYQQLPQPQPVIIINNKSFFEMVSCLQSVFKLNELSNNHNITNFNSNQASKLNKKIKNDNKTTQIASNLLINKQNEKLEKEKQSLLQEIDELSILKQQLEQQIIRQQRELSKKQEKLEPTLSQQNYNQLTQIIFAQAFTIQDMLQLDDQQHN